MSEGLQKSMIQLTALAREIHLAETAQYRLELVREARRIIETVERYTRNDAYEERMKRR